MEIKPLQRYLIINYLNKDELKDLKHIQFSGTEQFTVDELKEILNNFGEFVLKFLQIKGRL